MDKFIEGLKAWLKTRKSEFVDIHTEVGFYTTEQLDMHALLSEIDKFAADFEKGQSNAKQV